MTDIETIRVEVAYTYGAWAKIETVFLPKGATIWQALQRCGLEINPSVQAVGVFGRLCELDWVLHDADRVEIYASLLIDPKQARRLRASKDNSTS